MNRRLHNLNSSRGFTIIELMISIAVLAVIISIATPSFNSFVKNSRIDREAETLYSLLNSARQLAISTGRRGFVCRSTDIATPTCDTATNDGAWDDSKLMYTTTIDVALTSPGADFTNQSFQTINTSLTADQKRQVVGRVSESPGRGLNVIANSNDDVIVFSSEGRLLNSAPFRLAICDDRANPESFGKYIEINTTGRFKLKSTSADAAEVGCDAT